jgi:hypothetical protein
MILPLLTLLLGACATTSTFPAHLDALNPSHVDYPADRFFCAVGVSSGPSASAEDALNRAKQGVVAQVNSSIEVELSRTTSQDIVATDGRVRSKTKSQALTQLIQRSRYENSELIRVVDAGVQKNEHRAMACLNRAEAAQVIMDRSSNHLQRHTAAAKEAFRSTEIDDIAGFSAAYSEAQQTVGLLSNELYTARILLGGVSARHKQYNMERSQLVEQASVLRSTLMLHVAPEDISDAKGAKLVRQSLSRLGFRATSGKRPECVGGSGNYSIAVDLTMGCPPRTNSVGYFVCKPMVSVRVKSCAREEQVLTADVGGKALWGSSSRKGHAEQKALSHLDSNRLDALLASALSAALPSQ